MAQPLPQSLATCEAKQTIRWYRRWREAKSRIGVTVITEYNLLVERATDIDGESESDDPGRYENWKEAAREYDRTDDEIHSMFDSLR